MAEVKNYSILIVDDEELIRNNIGRFIESQGFGVFLAEDGIKAYEIICTQKIDLVVSDVCMPNGDGVELLNNIQNFKSGNPPLIFITGYSYLSEEQSLKLGARKIFSKPFDRKKLLNEIKLILGV